MKHSRLLIALSISVGVLAVITAGTGLFWSDGGEPFVFTTVHGQEIEMYGQGLYSNDTFFKAPILRGTDAVILLLAVPLLLSAVSLFSQGSMRGHLFLVSLLGCFLYYSTSLVFGVTYNELFLIYVFLFSASLFAFIIGIKTLDKEKLASCIRSDFPHRGTACFLAISGFSLFVWLIDIIGSMVTGHVPDALASYTTEVTYVLDLGIIAPVAFAASYSVFRRVPAGYLLSAIMLLLCSLIGVIVIAQTIAQAMAGITLNIVQAVAFVGVFVLLSGFAMTFSVRLFRSIIDDKSRVPDQVA